MTAGLTVRVSDADRDRFADQLREHAVQGRLTADEFAERVGAVYAATTRGELDGQVADLPVESAGTPDVGELPATGRSARTSAFSHWRCLAGIPLPCLLVFVVVLVVVLV